MSKYDIQNEDRLPLSLLICFDNVLKTVANKSIFKTVIYIHDTVKDYNNEPALTDLPIAIRISRCMHVQQDVHVLVPARYSVEFVPRETKMVKIHSLLTRRVLRFHYMLSLIAEPDKI